MRDSGYTYSHLGSRKGLEYSIFCETDRWVRYLWTREKLVLNRILKKCFRERRVRLLDFACGTGRVCGYLERDVRIEESVGVDVSESMLSVARRRVQRTQIHCYNILDSRPFPAKSFDLITAFRFFSNAEPELRMGVIDALVSLLAPGGYIVINIHQNSGSPYMRIQNYYARARGLPTLRTFSIEECAQIAAKHGMCVADAYGVGVVRVPRLVIPDRVYAPLERIVSRSSRLARYSLSPIVVLRHV